MTVRETNVRDICGTYYSCRPTTGAEAVGIWSGWIDWLEWGYSPFPDDPDRDVVSIGDLRASDLRPCHFNEWLDKFGPRRQHVWRQRFRRVFRWAIDAGHVRVDQVPDWLAEASAPKVDAAMLAELFGHKNLATTRRYLHLAGRRDEPKEPMLNELLRLATPVMRRVLVFLHMTGARAGELCRLQW